jgi:hypothetical protein
MRQAEDDAAVSLKLDPTRDFASDRDALIDLEITGTFRRATAAAADFLKREREQTARALLAPAIEAGARLVVYQYCVSILIYTFSRPSGVKLIAPGQNRVLVGLPYTLLTLVAGGCPARRGIWSGEDLQRLLMIAVSSSGSAPPRCSAHA